jgi:peptide deformylase
MPVDIEPNRFKVIEMLLAEQARLQNQAQALNEKVAEINAIVQTQLSDTATLKGVSLATHNLDLLKKQFVEK